MAMKPGITTYSTNEQKSQQQISQCDMLTWAKYYYDLGLTPLPCKPKAKEPICEWKQWQYCRPDWSEIEIIWEKAIAKHGHNNLNIATLLGEAHGLCAIDIDDPKKFRQARLSIGLSGDDLKTWIRKSHRGYALIYKYPQGYDLPPNIPNETFGAELLGNKHLLMFPPSIHPSGTRYCWFKGYRPGKIPLAEIPKLLLEAFGVAKKQDNGQDNDKLILPTSNFPERDSQLPNWAYEVIQTLSPYWRESHRHNLSLSLAGVLAKRGVNEEIAERILKKLAEENDDNELKDRLRVLMDTYNRLADGESILAWQGLERIVDEETLKKLDTLLPKPLTNTVARPTNPCTDLGNAERLVRLFGDRIKYVPQWGWLVWDGKRWVRDIGNLRVTKFAEETVRIIYEEASKASNQDDRTRLAHWAVTSESRQRITSMIELAAPMCLADPEEFDRDPYLLNCLNGVVDLRTKNLRPHDPNLKLTKLAPVNYVPDAVAPTWQKFLNDIFLGDKDLIAFIQRAVGYSITGDGCENVLFICYGSGSNGKTTFHNTILKVLGDYGKVMAVDALLKRREQADSHPTVLADLQGVRLAVAQEIEEGRHLAIARVKTLTGGDRIKARFMRKDYFDFDSTHKIWLATNYKPIISDTTYAMWRRIILIPFMAIFDETRRDKKMQEKLLLEAEGILAWLVQGCFEWQQQGLNPPKVVLEATEEYRTEMDRIQLWLEECCEADSKAITSFADLYASYESWCKEVGEEPLSKRRFGDRLSDKGFEKVTLPGGVKARKGLRLKNASPIHFPNDQAESMNSYPCADRANVPNFLYNASNMAIHSGNTETSAQQHISTDSTDLRGNLIELPQNVKFVETEKWLDELCQSQEMP